MENIPDNNEAQHFTFALVRKLFEQGVLHPKLQNSSSCHTSGNGKRDCALDLNLHELAKKRRICVVVSKNGWIVFNLHVLPI